MTFDILTTIIELSGSLSGFMAEWWLFEESEACLKMEYFLLQIKSPSVIL